MKALLVAAALAITGAVTVQAADIFTCGALGYAMHDGRVERVCSAPVTTHWTKLGELSPPWCPTSTCPTARMWW